MRCMSSRRSTAKLVSHSADLTDIQPAEYRADLVVLLLDHQPVFGIVVEAQLSPDEDKRFVWPVYAVNLRARLRCPVCLLVITADDAVAHGRPSWCCSAARIGFHRLCSVLPACRKSSTRAQAEADPELAVLSAMAHGKDADTHKSVRIATAAQLASLRLDASRARLVFRPDHAFIERGCPQGVANHDSSILTNIKATSPSTTFPRVRRKVGKAAARLWPLGC